MGVELLDLLKELEPKSWLGDEEICISPQHGWCILFLIFDPHGDGTEPLLTKHKLLIIFKLLILNLLFDF